MTRSKVRPLLVRPGAAFSCEGDGLCCTSIHLIGPIGRRDAARLRLLEPSALVRDDDEGDTVLALNERGGCIFLGDGRCELHAAHGEDMKAHACRRYPYDLTATPVGGRITTEHRCPCRTMGDPPPIEAERAEVSLAVAGRLRAYHRVGSRIKLAKRRTVGFAKWQKIEAELLERLAAGEAPATVLEAEPFPDLDGVPWELVAMEMRGLDGPERIEVAFGWFGDGIALCEGEGRVPLRERPWQAAFERAEARSPSQRKPREVFADFIADQIWALKWTELGGFDVARLELATRLAVGETLYRRLRRTGTRPDRAAAEAVMIIDIMGYTDWWLEVVARMRR